MRARLRAATETSHDALDAKMAAMLDRGSSGYVEFLRVSAQAVLPLEEALKAAGVASILPDWRERSRGAALRADLAALGVIAPPAMAVRLPREEAYLLGVLYTLEGSRLGAKLLAGRVEAAADASMRNAVQYLRHGEGRDFWQTFLVRLEASQAARDAPDRAIRGALATFAAFDPGTGSVPRPPSGKLPRYD